MSRFQAMLAALFATLAAFFVLPFGNVFADAVAPLGQADNHALILTPVVWTILTGLVMPFVLALLMKASANPTIKGVVGILAAFLAALIERATLADGQHVISAALLLDMLMIYAPQLLTYLGLWKQVGINDKVAPRIGIG